jgi:hypothetical protein
LRERIQKLITKLCLVQEWFPPIDTTAIHRSKPIRSDDVAAIITKNEAPVDTPPAIDDLLQSVQDLRTQSWSDDENSIAEDDDEGAIDLIEAGVF